MDDPDPVVLDDLRGGGILPADLPRRVLVLRQLGPIFGLKHSALGRLELAGDLKRFEILPRVGKRARYSGKKLQAWYDGELALVGAPSVFDQHTRGRR
jgi:hypothetical protein